MGCAEVQRLLEDQVTACRGKVTVLRAELERINVLVAERESDLMRLVSALEVVAALPALHPAPATLPLAGAGPGALPASVPVLVAGGSDPEAFTAGGPGRGGRGADRRDAVSGRGRGDGPGSSPAPGGAGTPPRQAAGATRTARREARTVHSPAAAPAHPQVNSGYVKGPFPS